jgi:hypothetical protein
MQGVRLAAQVFRGRRNIPIAADLTSRWDDPVALSYPEKQLIAAAHRLFVSNSSNSSEPGNPPKIGFRLAAASVGHFKRSCSRLQYFSYFERRRGKFVKGP